MSVFDDFKHLWTGETDTATAVPDMAEQEDAKFKAARRADAESAESTHYLTEYRDWLAVQIDSNDPDPDKGVESAAMRGHVQATYRKCLRRLNEQLRMSRE